MAEPIVEQIGQWIANAIDGKKDPDNTLTLRSVRPKILDWEPSDFRHGDVIIELVSSETQSKRTTGSRTELATWKLYGIICELPEDTVADTVLARIAETIRKTLLAGNSAGRACGGIALNIDCPKMDYANFVGGILAMGEVKVMYMTNLFDGYSAP